MYTRLSERLGLTDHLMVLNIMLGKIATNLKVYGSCDAVIQLTLDLFQVPPWQCDVMSRRVMPLHAIQATVQGPRSAPVGRHTLAAWGGTLWPNCDLPAVAAHEQRARPAPPGNGAQGLRTWTVGDRAALSLVSATPAPVRALFPFQNPET